MSRERYEMARIDIHIHKIKDQINLLIKEWDEVSSKILGRNEAPINQEATHGKSEEKTSKKEIT